jgi:hypothetical protein
MIGSKVKKKNTNGGYSMTQFTLPFNYELEPTSSDVTALAGLPLYIELLHGLGFHRAVDDLVAVRPTQGWTDGEMVQALVLLNIAGGTAVDDIAILENDAGLHRTIRAFRHYGRTPKEIEAYNKRFRQEQLRAFPSPSSIFRWLEVFHDEEQELLREEHTAFIPKPKPCLVGLSEINTSLVKAVQHVSPCNTATLDMDATLIESYKKNITYCYKGFPAFQPVNVVWAEQDLLVYSEFRDGNVPAGYELLRVLKESVKSLPTSVHTIYLRSDSAGYQWDLLKYCAEKRGKNKAIKFSVSVDVTPAFKEAVSEVGEKDWQPLYKWVAGKKVATKQQWAEVCYVPNEVATKKHGPEYRFIAIREPVHEQLWLENVEPQQLSFPFPTMEMTTGTHLKRYKITGLVTNRTLPGNELITWHRKRCGTGEKVQGILKNDVAGGQLPTGLFGANACWWAIVILSYNLNVLMKTLAMDPTWKKKRLKALRFEFISRPGRIIQRAHSFFIRVHGSLLKIIEPMRMNITQVAPIIYRE